MESKCKTYWEQGVKASMNAGQKPANWAACNIYKIQHSSKSSGLGKGGRSTRRGSRKNRRNSRTRKDSRSRRNRRNRN